MMVTLRDEFGFGTERIERASKRFWQKADCIEGDYTTQKSHNFITNIFTQSHKKQFPKKFISHNINHGRL